MTVRQPGEPEQGEVMTDDEIIALAVAHLGKIEMTRQDGEELVISTRSLDLVTAMLAFARALIAAEQESVKKWQGLADASATLLSVVQARHARDLAVERESRAADARRYRWLRDEAAGGEWSQIGNTTSGDSTDAAIDAYIHESGK